MEKSTDYDENDVMLKPTGRKERNVVRGDREADLRFPPETVNFPGLKGLWIESTRIAVGWERLELEANGMQDCSTQFSTIVIDHW